jgi:hypothetical protein
MSRKANRAATMRYREDQVRRQIAECELHHDEEDVREAARYLSRERYVPEPTQEEIDFNY